MATDIRTELTEVSDSGLEVLEQSGVAHRPDELQMWLTFLWQCQELLYQREEWCHTNSCPFPGILQSKLEDIPKSIQGHLTRRQ
jgi:hypothetical protein